MISVSLKIVRNWSKREIGLYEVNDMKETIEMVEKEYL